MVDFTATWCGPCRMIAPFFEALADKFPGLWFFKVDVDTCTVRTPLHATTMLPLTRLACQGVAAECGIQAMPTFQVRLVPTRAALQQPYPRHTGAQRGAPRTAAQETRARGLLAPCERWPGLADCAFSFINLSSRPGPAADARPAPLAGVAERSEGGGAGGRQ